jgi:hypothetical protein
MSRHPGMPVDRSGSNEFFSDANLNLRAQPAGYEDFAPLPGESMTDAMAASPALQSIARHGGALTPLQLAEVEVDDGGVSADRADWTEPAAYPMPHAPAAAPVDDSSLDRLADLILARVEKKLLGGS